jgi:oxaloacetate decarboxylase alpha subunit
MLRGEYGQLPAPVNEEVRKKAIGEDEVITCRPADLLSPELEQYTKEAGDLAKCEEDVLSYALFPQVAGKFLEERNAGAAKKETAAKNADPNAVRELFIDDTTVNAI